MGCLTAKVPQGRTVSGEKGMADATVAERVERRLAVILAAEVFGYRRLLGAKRRARSPASKLIGANSSNREDDGR